MMGVFPHLGSMMPLAAISTLLNNMDDHQGQREEQDFYPPQDESGQPREQRVILPSLPSAPQPVNNPTGYFPSAAVDTSYGFARSGQRSPAPADDDRKPAARSSVSTAAVYAPLGASESFESSHAKHPSPNIQETLAVSSGNASAEQLDSIPHGQILHGFEREYNYETGSVPPQAMYPPPAIPVAAAAATVPQVGVARSAQAARRLEDDYDRKPAAKATKKKPTPKKKAAPAKPQRRNTRRGSRVLPGNNRAGENVEGGAAAAVAVAVPAAAFEIPHFQASEQEIAECSNSRKLHALNNFYTRLNELAVYRSVHGDCRVPQAYDENKKLGVWVNKVRMEKKKWERGERSSLSETKITHLESLEFDWGTSKGDDKWEEHYAELQAYFDEHQHSNVPTKYPNNPALGRWVSTQRCEYKKFQKHEPCLIDQDKIDRLETLNFVWVMLSLE